MTSSEVETEVRAGCPCGERGDCCDDPQPVPYEHECDEIDEFCEDCYATECTTCGRVCHCGV